MKSGKNALRLGLLLVCLLLAASLLEFGGVPYITREKRWSIGIVTGPSPLLLRDAGVVPNPVLSRDDVTDVPAKFVADPFMIRRDSTWYMFFEVLNERNGRGEIGLATSGDAQHWRYERIVLAEPFHLSYPYVFAFAGEHYLIPESGGERSVRLYKAEDFPTKWVYTATLLAGQAFADSSVMQHDGTWFLFTETRPYINDTLGLYYADALTGPWHEHPKSPIVANDPHISRPAGRIVASDGKLFRFAQDDAPNYGIQVYAFEITALTSAIYEERPVGEAPILGPSGDGWNAKGMHHLDPHRLDASTWIACVDGARRSWALRFYSGR